MKKFSFIIFPAIIFAVLITSCGEENNGPSGEDWSPSSVEENKVTVEEAGIDFVNTMDRMNNVESIEVLMNYVDIMSSAGSKGSVLPEDSKLLSTINTFTAVAKGDEKLNSLFKEMASAKDLAEDPESILQFWNDNVGTYTWNAELNDWDIDLGGNSIIFLFPSSDASETNDASLTIYNYSGVTINDNPIEDEYAGDFPAALNADLKVDNVTLVSFVFGATYNTDGIPSAIACDLTIESFKFEIDITNTTTVVGVNYKLLENNQTVIDLGASGKGLFTEENYDNNTYTQSETHYYYDYVYNEETQQWEYTQVPYTEEWEETEFEEILNSASAHFQLFNIAIRGDINVKGLVDQIRIIDEDVDNEDIDWAEADSLYAVNINKYLNLRLVEVSTNDIMAKAEAYVVHDIEYDDTYIDFRLTFGDGSPVDVETYFEEGFSDFIDELNAFIADLNTEYDFELEPVEY